MSLFTDALIVGTGVSIPILAAGLAWLMAAYWLDRRGRR